MVEPITLPELPEDSPAGPNLELDAAFGEMERAARGKPESQYGNTIEPAEPPDWKASAALAETLLGRTRDLRIMTLLAVARLHLLGISAYAEVVNLIRREIETNWEHVHPQLDPEEANDPMQRANALLILQDAGRVLRPMRDAPLAGTGRVGTVSWRDIAVLNGTLEAEPGRQKLSEPAIRAIFAGSDPGRLSELGDAVATTLADLDAIPAVFDSNAGSGSGPDFTELVKLLRDIRKALDRYQPSPAEAGEPDPETAAEPDPADATSGARGATRGRGAVAIQTIVALNTREEALHALELAAAYFRANEPSSPLPLLIDRAKRLAPLAFLEILQDLAPDGLAQARGVAGVRGEAL